jgi:phosphohistidine phosphatase
VKLRLILLRHAKSAWDTDAPSDHARPLNKRGRRDAPRVAQALVELGWTPERIFSSDAVRTRQTCERMLEAFGRQTPIEWSAELYHAGGDAIRKQLHEASGKTLMVVGHNPGWEEAVEELAGKPVRLTTCNAALLSVKAASWAAALDGEAWKVERVVRPKEL